MTRSRTLDHPAALPLYQKLGFTRLLDGLDGPVHSGAVAPRLGEQYALALSSRDPGGL